MLFKSVQILKRYAKSYHAIYMYLNNDKIVERNVMFVKSGEQMIVRYYIFQSVTQAYCTLKKKI